MSGAGREGVKESHRATVESVLFRIRCKQTSGATITTIHA